MLQRIQKIMAQAGVASRRKCEELIKQGKVKVNGVTAKLGNKADDQKDRIEVNGKPIKKENKLYIIINKPRGIISSAHDERGRKSIVRLVKTKERIFPVGRLDYDAEGLMILTNDGDFANRIIHPRYNIKKTYSIRLDRKPSDRALYAVLNGVAVDGRKVNVIDLRQDGGEIFISLHEGRKHIIKRMFQTLGYFVAAIKRVSIGNLKLELEPGKYKQVTKEWLERRIF